MGNGIWKKQEGSQTKSSASVVHSDQTGANITNRWTSRLGICLDRPNFVLIVGWCWLMRRRWSTLCYEPLRFDSLGFANGSKGCQGGGQASLPDPRSLLRFTPWSPGAPVSLNSRGRMRRGPPSSQVFTRPLKLSARL